MKRPRPEGAPQRQGLRFCKAFFEVRELGATRERLLERGIQGIGEGEEEPGGCSWYLWEADLGEVETVPFLLRLFAERLILEGPTPKAVGRGWRLLAEWLEPAAVPRVAAGDDLARFVPRRRRRSADRPETMDTDARERVLREFYAAFHSRWVEQPHAALGGEPPRRAAESDDPEVRGRLLELLSRLAEIERLRRARGQACFSVARIRDHLGIDAEDGAGGAP